MTEEDDAPVLISTFDSVLEQIHRLVADIETHRLDAGVVVMVKDGEPDIHGLGVVDTTEAAAALLFVAFKMLPPTSHDAMLAKLGAIIERSRLVAKEAPLWRL